MGAHPWWYFVPYDPDPERALQALRAAEFAAGRYNPVISFPAFPITSDSPTPGPRHPSIAAALAAAKADGTRSILDMERVGSTPTHGVITPLDGSKLQAIYRTEHPTRAMVESSLDFLEVVERGQGVYFVLYQMDRPDELVFAGYSYD